MALIRLGKCFLKLDVAEKVMPYNVNTYEHVIMGGSSIQSALDVLKKEHHSYIILKNRFVSVVKVWEIKCLIKHSNIYCKIGCKVLMDGYCVFQGWVLEHTELDVDSYIAIQPLASSCMLGSGCYDNVFQTSVLQQFISRCVVGGRVMCNSNEMYHVKKKTADLDACSLYPSAMFFMGGFLKGLPQVLKNTSYDFSKIQDGYFIRIKIIKLSKELDLPPTTKN